MPYDLRTHLSPPRVTNAMWDFSWLMGHYEGGPMGDWDRFTDELGERLFNAVRIDAFPLVLAQTSAEQPVTFSAAPESTWGHSTRDVVHRVGAELVEFVTLCRRKNLKVILSTWAIGGQVGLKNRDDLAGRRDQLIAGWEAVLRLLAAHGLLDCILYVDFDQEFPYFSLHQKELNDLAGKATASGEAAAMEAAGQRPIDGGLQWNPAQMAFVKNYWQELLTHFQRGWPQLRFTFSLTSFWKEARAMNLKAFDVLELHCWIHGHRFDERTGFNRDLDKSRKAGDRSAYQLRLDQTMASMRPMLLAEMDQQLAGAAAWAKEISAPLITSESWGPWWHMDHPDLRWDWLQDWCRDCMGLAAQHGFWGVTPWNFSHPYFSSWKDIGWYRAVNGAFLHH